MLLHLCEALRKGAADKVAQLKNRHISDRVVDKQTLFAPVKNALIRKQ